MSTIADYTYDFYSAQVGPKSTPDDLTLWWAMRKSDCYSPFKVKVTKHEVVTDGAGKKDRLYFTLVRDIEGRYGEFNVDLKDETQDAWPFLPSTAQLATASAPFGFLLLSLEWQDREQLRLKNEKQLDIDFASLDEGGKWPIGAFEDDEENLRSRLRRLEDRELGEELLRTLDTLRARRGGR